jgi:hypothetical protein
MTTYVIETMTKRDYHDSMRGDLCMVYTVNIEANTAEEAVAIAKEKYPTRKINEKYVETLEQAKAEEEKWQRIREEVIREQEQAKQKRIEREERKAKELGMTVEEYKAEKNRQRKIKKLEKEIAEYEEKLRAAKAYLKRLEK